MDESMLTPASRESMSGTKRNDAQHEQCPRLPIRWWVLVFARRWQWRAQSLIGKRGNPHRLLCQHRLDSFCSFRS